MTTHDGRGALELDALARMLRDDDAIGAGAPPQFDVAAAEAAGLVDIGYTTTDSPVGRLLLASTERGLLLVSYADHRDPEATLARLAARVSPRIVAAPRRLDGPRRELEEYFERRRRGFETPIDWRLTAGFTRRILQATAAIPYGEVSSYAGVAAAAGSPRATRAAGNALGSNPLPIVVPCHRVLRSGGALGGYTGGIERKRALLDLERG